MDENTTGQEPSSSDKESKLDQWIRQTLKIGSQKPESKIQHVPNPAQNPVVKVQGPSRGQENRHPARQQQRRGPQPPHHSTANRQSPAPRHGNTPRPQQRQQRGPERTPLRSQLQPQSPQKEHKPAVKKPYSFNHKGGLVFGSGSQDTPNNATGAGNQSRTQTQRQGQPQSKDRLSHKVPNFFGKAKLRVIPIGGLNEVGKNCMVLEYGNDIIIIDIGFQFPDEDLLGVDYVIPDTTYLNDKIDRIRGVFFTHGHLDHIGAIPYLTAKLNYPVMYGTKLTMGLVEKRLEEFALLDKSRIKVIKANDTIKLGPFSVTAFAVNHSIPDAVGFLVKTPAGNIVHTGDFKFDFTPAKAQKTADFSKIAALGGENVTALFSDSTNALKPGYTVSEKVIADSLEGIFKNITGRIVIASFASQIGRLQSIVDLAKKYHRTIFVSGRSLIDNIYIASKLGYLNVPEGLIHDIKKVHKIPEENSIILTTGSQGESVSSLSRMASEEHPQVKIKKGDTVILSSSPIPGNERAVTTLTNNLSRLGARIINNQIMDVHASGHAQQEDIKLMMSLVRAKYVVPVHGEYFMRYGSTELAQSIGYDEKHAVMIENGDVIEIENDEVRVVGEKVQNNYILVDGLGVGDIGAQVIMDRQTMAENGMLIVIIPVDEKSKKIKGEIEIISRGFIYMKESEEIIQSIKQATEQSYRGIMEKRADLKRGEIKKYIGETLDKIIHEKIERHPLILPIILEK